MGVTDPVDGRQTLITLTDAFRQRLQAYRSAKNDWLHGTLEMQLSAAEQAQLAAAVRLLQRLAD